MRVSTFTLGVGHTIELKVITILETLLVNITAALGSITHEELKVSIMVCGYIDYELKFVTGLVGFQNWCLRVCINTVLYFTVPPFSLGLSPTVGSPQRPTSRWNGTLLLSGSNGDHCPPAANLIAPTPPALRQCGQSANAHLESRVTLYTWAIRGFLGLPLLMEGELQVPRAAVDTRTHHGQLQTV